MAIWLLRRLVLAPAIVVLTGLLWVTVPLWLIAAAALSPLLPGRWRALRLLWVVDRLPDLRGDPAGGPAGPVDLVGVRPADPDAVLRGHPLRPGAGHPLGILPGGEAGAEPHHRDRRTDAGRAPRDPDPGVLPARRSRRLVHADPRVDARLLARAAGGAQGHDGLGPRHRGRPQPDPVPVHLPEPGGRHRPREPDHRPGHRPGRERRLGDLPRGRQLHPRPTAARDRPAAQARPGADGGARRAADPRARAATGRRARRAGRRPGRRRRDGGAHRPRPPRLGRATCGASCRWTSG